VADRGAGASTPFGLLAAQLTDRLRWGNLAKSLIFMPMAISFVGASVIWKLIYDARPAGQDQIGILNALYLWFGGTDPQTWLTIPFWNNFFLMIVLVWIQTGFAMVILSAALRGIPEETIEAAIIDGASPVPDLLQDQGAADHGHHRRGLDHDHDHRAQGIRHRAGDDQRAVADAGSGQLHV
jgi:ABC-type sugar transport system permease subunit